MRFLGTVFCLLSSVFCPLSWAATYASDGSRADVQAKIDSAVDGDIVTIPSAGSPFTWTSGVTISGKGIHLRGAGAGRSLARSNSSVTVGTGTKTFTLITENVASIESLKSGITAGATLRIWRPGGEIDVIAYGGGGAGAGVSGNLPWMEGTVTSLVGSTLTMNITSTNFSGTHAVWIITTNATTTVVINHSSSAPAAGLTLTERVGANIEVSGIRFTHHDSSSNAYLIFVGQTASAEPVLIHDCWIQPTKSGSSGVWFQTNKGVLWDCSFPFLPASAGSCTGVSVKPVGDTTSWTLTSNMGTADTTGKNNVYVEDCDFHFSDDIFDVDDNGRAVIRYSLFNNAGIGVHGADTSNYGARYVEVYNSEFIFSDPTGGIHAYNINGFFITRGGTGLVTDCIINNIDSPSSWGDKSELQILVEPLDRNAGPNPLWGANNDTAITAISQANPTVISSTAHGMVTGDYVRITGSDSTPTVNGYRQITRVNDNSYTVAVNVTVAGTTGKSNPVDYHCPRQVGFGYVTGSGLDGQGRSSDSITYVGDSEPLYFWNNTGTHTLSTGASGYGEGTDNDTAADYLIAGRDYFDDGTAKPSWTRYTYPHPLRTDASGSYSPTGKGSRSLFLGR